LAQTFFLGSNFLPRLKDSALAQSFCLGSKIPPWLEVSDLYIKKLSSAPGSTFQGGLRLCSVGTNSLWGVNSEGRVVVRLGISADTPAGREWVTVDGEPMKQVTIGRDRFGRNFRTNLNVYLFM
jgi:hypothetical protein